MAPPEFSVPRNREAGAVELTAFIEARLAEDEAVARAAGGRVWSVDPDNACRVEGGITIYDEGGHNEHQAAHIARKDPARALRQVAVKRQILVWCGRMDPAVCPRRSSSR